MPADPENVSFYKDVKGVWRWKITAANGRLIGSSSEGYKNRKDCEWNLGLVGNSIVQNAIFMILTAEE